MEHIDNIIGIIIIGIVAAVGIWLLPDGSGKEIAIAAVSGITGYMTKGISNGTKQSSDQNGTKTI